MAGAVKVAAAKPRHSCIAMIIATSAGWGLGTAAISRVGFWTGTTGYITWEVVAQLQ